MNADSLLIQVGHDAGVPFADRAALVNADSLLIQVGHDAGVPFADRAALVVGRSRDADLPVRDPACSRRQFRVRRAGDGFVLEPLSENSPTFCEGSRVTGPVPVRVNALIEAGTSRFRIVAAKPADSRSPAANVGAIRETVRQSGPIDDTAPALAPIRLTGDVTLGRDPANATVTLSHPLVSRRHALVRRHAEGAVIKDLGSANGTFVNGKRLGVAVRIDTGDRVQIGPFAWTLSGGLLMPTGPAADTPKAAGRLVAQGLHVTGKKGQLLLTDLSIAFHSSEFVAIIGPSGCGKSTLIKALAGITEPTSGRVVFDGCDLYAAPAGATRRIAVVPQREVLPDVLTVAAALRYTAALRLPPDTTSAELDHAVTEVLARVGLSDRGCQRIASLSGGQLKRVGLANELFADPGLVVLDEVTSGLDEQSDREMMGLFRHLATAGKTVVAVTHTLAHVPEFCHRVVVLTPGGRLAFVGSPAEALDYFRIERLGDVYERLQEAWPEEWSAQFASSARSFCRVPLPPAVEIEVTPVADSVAAVKHQLPILASRTARTLVADARALVLSAIQPILVSALIIGVFGDVHSTGNTPATAASARSVLFILCVTAFWLGCNTAAREIVREWNLYCTERRVGISPAAYLLSKWCILVTLTAAQIAGLYLVVRTGCHLPGELRPTLVLLISLGAAGVSAGLLASAVATTQAFAVGLVPLLVIPQIVLTDVFRPPSGLSREIADRLGSTHRGFGGVLAALPPDLSAVVAPTGVTIGGATTMLLMQSIGLALASWAVLKFRGLPLKTSAKINPFHTGGAS